MAFHQMWFKYATLPSREGYPSSCRYVSGATQARQAHLNCIVTPKPSKTSGFPSAIQPPFQPLNTPENALLCLPQRPEPRLSYSLSGQKGPKKLLVRMPSCFSCHDFPRHDYSLSQHVTLTYFVLARLLKGLCTRQGSF